MDEQSVEVQECPFKKRKIEETNSCDNQVDSFTENNESEMIPASDANKHDELQEESSAKANNNNQDDSEGNFFTHMTRDLIE